MEQRIKDECYTLSLQGYNERQIAKKTNLGTSTVHRAIASITKSHEYQLAVITMAQFLERFSRAGDYFELKKAELENLMLETENVDQKIKIIALQVEIESKALVLAKQGQLIEAIKALKDGKIRLNELTGDTTVTN